jgi:internalin A
VTGDSDVLSLIAEAARSGAEELKITERPMEALPAEIGGLRHLKQLTIRRCGLKSLPPEIGNLRKLEYLDLASNELVTVPREIGKLEELTYLDLSDNQLTFLPPEIERLTKLGAILLIRNNFTDFPRLPKTDSSLTILLLFNQIREIPPSIGELNIHYLDMNSNHVSIVASEIGRLSGLRTLHLGNNRIMHLPPGLGTLPESINLRLNGNPLAEPLPELVERGTPALLAYLRSLQDGTRQYEAKLLLVGEGNVGKSSLVAALHGKPFVPNRSTTHGIEITQLNLPHPSRDEQITLNTWDFGGQEVYRITHQFFFSRRCLYLLVWRPREGQEENAIEEWCRRIRLRIGEDARILIVATHADERRAELDYPYLRRQFGDLLAGHYEVDNRSGRGIPELREAIIQLSAGLPQMGELVSSRWIAVRDELETIAEPQITYARYAEICERHAIDDGQRSALIGLLHDLGQLIYYGEDDGLRDIVVLQPEWLTKAIGYVLEDGATEKSGGILAHRRLAAIWQDPHRDTRYPKDCHRYFLRMMEKFDVSYRIPDEDESLVAQLVPYEEPALPWQADQPPRQGQRQLTLICRMADAAPGLVPWLTVRNHRFTTGRHWRRGVFLEHREHQAQALLVQQRARDLKLVVRAPSPDYFFSILRDSVESLIRRRWEGLDYEMLIPCPQVVDGGRCMGEFELRTLQKYREREIPAVRCTRCIEEQNVTELMTGFALADVPLARVLDEVNHRAGEIHTDLGRRVDEIKSHQSQVAASHAADLASQLRALMRAAGREMPDCPRLFTLVPRAVRGWARVKAWQDSFRLILWCEHPGQEHPWPAAQYDFTRPTRWLATVAPYALVLCTVLRAVVPIGGAALGMAMSEQDYKQIKNDLDLMKALVERLPEDRRKADLEAQLWHGAEGAAFRALRALLVELDPAMSFGDLRRVLTPAGDYLWICPRPEHYRVYDPGLPTLP